MQIHAYTVVLIWIGRAPFHEHTNEKHLVDYLELNILPKVCEKGCEKGPEWISVYPAKQNRASVYPAQISRIYPLLLSVSVSLWSGYLLTLVPESAARGLG